MGRDKGARGAAAKGGATTELAEKGVSQPITSCGLCRKEVGVGDEHILGQCSKCGELPFHRPCVCEYLERTLKVQIREGGYGTAAWNKIKEKIAQRPHMLFAQNGRAQKLPQGCPVCQAGLMESAEMVRPVRKIAAPPPPPAPRQRAAPPPAPPPKTAAPKQLAAAQTAPQAASATAALRQAAAESRAGLAARSGSSLSKSTSAGGGYGSTLAGLPSRPQWLQMCRDGDDCYTYNCPYCHSREEQSEREQRHAEEQREAARQRRQQELEAHRRQQEEHAAAAAAAAGAEAEVQAAVRRERLRAETLAREEAALPLSDDALRLMKRHKRETCISSLLEMGFDQSTAARAADAAGCELTAAATLLMEPQGGGGSMACSVVREARKLLAAAAALGVGAAGVDAALVAANGSWEQTLWETQPATPEPLAKIPAAAPATQLPAVAVGSCFDAGFAAGMAAALAAAEGASAAGGAAQDAWYASGAGGVGYVPPPQMDRPPPPEEEVEEWMGMLGLA
ncbi:hypothetical protein ABPG75_004913 [Micractinium tetrahymenae]